ncbi:MAG: hypothetical protein AAGM22_22695 [Acidobacteriota bacterium]
MAPAAPELLAPLTVREVAAGSGRRLFFSGNVPGLPGGDLTLEQGDLMGWSLSSGDSGRAEWSLSLPASSAGSLGPLLTERHWGAPPPGKLPVHLSVGIEIDGVETVIPLLTDGLSIDSDRAYGVPDSIDEPVHEMSLDGLDAMGRYDRKRVSLKLPAYHGLTHGQLLARLFELAGVPSNRIQIGAEVGEPLNTAVDIIDEEAFAVAREVAEAANVAYLMDCLGDLITRPLVPGVNVPPVWTLRLEGFALSEKIRVQSSGEVPTCIVILGNAPERTDAAAAGGVVVTVEREEVYREVAVPGAYFQQGGPTTGDLFPLAQPGPLPSALTLVEATETIQATKGGCPLYDETVSYGLYAPEHHRYALGVDGEPEFYASCWIYEAGATQGDATAAYAWPRHRFVELTRERTEYVRDAAGRKIAEPVRVGNWLTLEAALQERPNTNTAWEDVDYLAGVKVMGGGKGTVFDTELYFGGPAPPVGLGGTIAVNPRSLVASHWAEQRETDYTLRPDNYVTGSYAETTDWSRPEGSTFRYSSGESRWNRDAARTPVTTSVRYRSRGESQHQIIETVRREGETPATTKREGQGYLPKADIWDPEAEDRTLSREVRGKVCGLQSSHVEHEAPAREMSYIETPEQATAVATRELTQLSASRVSGAMPLNPLMQRLQPVAVDMPTLHAVGTGWIEDVSHGQSVGAPALTRLVIKMREI